MGKDKVIEILKDVFDVEDYYDGYSVNEVSGEEKEGYDINLLETFGGEGYGDSISYIFELFKDNKPLYYFECYGYYDSWNGTEWNDIDIVLPKPNVDVKYVLTENYTQEELLKSIKNTETLIEKYNNEIQPLFNF